MMPPDTATVKPPPKDDTPPSSATTRKAAPPAKQPPPEQQQLKCPRCDSSNTKFCYYNNYSLTQPRHFCKTCRRYWTKGGALRNVPIGGGCRKNKKVKSSSSSSSTTTNLHHHLSVVDFPKECSDFGGGLNLKYFSGITPAVDFHLAGLPAFPARVHSSSTSGGPYGQFPPPPFSDVPPPPPPSSSFLTTPPPPRFPPDSSSGSLLGFNYPLPSFSTNSPNINGQVGDEVGTNLNINSSIASSIESLSSINQDLHWKLQQQRLSMLFGSNGENTQKEASTVVPSVSNIENAPDHHHHHRHHHQEVKPQHANFLVQNQDNNSLTKPADVPGNSRKDGDAATEWFFGNSYAPTDSDGNGDCNGNGSAWNGGIQGWSGGGRNLNQFTALP